MIDFSIIIPVLNRVGYISKAINSILEQDYNSYEIVVVDNGSTDGTLKLLKEYEIEDKIKLLHSKNKGVSYARNIGIKNAKGYYIHILDSDNYFTNNKSLTKLKGIIDGVTTPWNVLLTANINEKGENISWSPIMNTILSEKEYLKTSGEFSITTKTNWFLENLHPEIPGVTHEIIFPAFFFAAEESKLYISDYQVQTYTEEAPDRLSSKALTMQQIVNYKFYFKTSLEKTYPFLPLKQKIILLNKFFIYNKLSKSEVSLNIKSAFAFLRYLYLLVPYKTLKKFVERLRA